MRSLWILILALALILAFAFQGVNGDEHHNKGHGHKVSHRDGIHHHHRDVGRSSSFSKHIDKSSHHSKHGIKKHNKHIKHHDGKKHHSHGNIHHH